MNNLRPIVLDCTWSDACGAYVAKVENQPIILHLVGSPSLSTAQPNEQVKPKSNRIKKEEKQVIINKIREGMSFEQLSTEHSSVTQVFYTKLRKKVKFSPPPPQRPVNSSSEIPRKTSSENRAPELTNTEQRTTIPQTGRNSPPSNGGQNQSTSVPFHKPLAGGES